MRTADDYPMDHDYLRTERLVGRAARQYMRDRIEALPLTPTEQVLALALGDVMPREARDVSREAPPAQHEVRWTVVAAVMVRVSNDREGRPWPGERPPRFIALLDHLAALAPVVWTDIYVVAGDLAQRYDDQCSQEGL